MSTTKPFKSIDEQLNILKERKLIISNNDIEKARLFLLNNNYYRISGYSLTLRKSDSFFNDITINTLIQIYEVDRRMRHVILSICEVIEVRLKSLIAYYHTEAHGPTGYLDINTFNCISNTRVEITTLKNYLNITRKADQQKKLIGDSELFLKHHQKNKDGILPFWVYVEILTISDVSKLYTILEKDVQKKIAINFGFKSSNGNVIIENLLHCTSILRNICAHGGRLYNRTFIRKPSLSTKEKSLLRIENETVIYDKLFSYILILKSLTLTQDFEIVSEHIKEIHNNYPLIDFKYYGFPDNWAEIL